MPMIRRFASHSALALAEAGLVALLAAALIGGTALAGKPGSGPLLTCSATPDPVAAGDLYTIRGSGYPTGKQLVVNVVNDHGTLVLFAGTSSGTIAVSAYASWAGQQSVKVYDNSRRRATLIGSCSFDVS